MNWRITQKWVMTGNMIVITYFWVILRFTFFSIQKIQKKNQKIVSK